ncbi:MAG: vitamin K epoxide reductase family protein, partial [bacterium]|nr:vitamin K epoxide reductase family protein [bacterium]
DIGLVYFSGGFLTLLFSLLTNHITQVESALFLLLAINLPALLYTVFSVVYQAVVVRSWCWLCLAIQAIFWIEYLMLSRFLYPPASGENQTVSLVFSLPFVLGFGLSLLVWFTLRPVIIDAERKKFLETKLKRLSRSPLYIQSQLEEAPEKEMGKFPMEVGVGPGDAEFTLTLVINPFCSRCGKDVLELDRLVRTNDGHIKGIIRFMTYGETGDKGSLDYEVAKHIILVAGEGKPGAVIQALKEWYSLSRGSSSKQLGKQFGKWK